MTLISLVELTPANFHPISVNDNFNSSFVGIRDIPGRVKARSKSEFNFQELRTPLCGGVQSTTTAMRELS